MILVEAARAQGLMPLAAWPRCLCGGLAAKRQPAWLSRATYQGAAHGPCTRAAGSLCHPAPGLRQTCPARHSTARHGIAQHSQQCISHFMSVQQFLRRNLGNLGTLHAKERVVYAQLQQ